MARNIKWGAFMCVHVYMRMTTQFLYKYMYACEYYGLQHFVSAFNFVKTNMAGKLVKSKKMRKTDMKVHPQATKAI